MQPDKQKQKIAYIESKPVIPRKKKDFLVPISLNSQTNKKKNCQQVEHKYRESIQKKTYWCLFPICQYERVKNHHNVDHAKRN